MKDESDTSKDRVVTKQGPQIPSSSSAAIDIVDNLYRISFDEAIEPLSSKHAKYYKAYSNNSGKEYFAIVFDRGFNVDTKMIDVLQNSPTPFINNPIASATIKISTNPSKHIVVIVPWYDYTSTLEAHLKNLPTDNSEYLVQKLLPFLCEVIQFCKNNHFNCGNICPSNIIIDEDKLILKEPFATYPHSTQRPHFLAVEISDADMCGRKTSSISADIYAAGVTMLYTFLGSGGISTESLSTFPQERLELGSLKAIIGNRRISDDIRTQIKGCMSDDVSMRWKLGNLLDWMYNKSEHIIASSESKASASTELQDMFSPVNFNGKNYSHQRGLASALYHSWDKGLNFLNEDRVIKWIQRSLGKSKAIDALDELINTAVVKQSSIGGFIGKEDRLAKAIIALDPEGPIRLGTFASQIQSFGSMMFNAHVTNNRSHIDIMLNICLKNIWQDRFLYIAKDEIDTDIVKLLEQIEGFYHSNIRGCGTERILYHLNPDMPCLSKLVYSDYITTLKDLLVKLDYIAGSSEEEIIFDQHIISFIAHKINLRREVYISMLKDIPANSDELSIYLLSIFALAKKQVSDLTLANISHLLCKRMTHFIDKELRNVTTKKALKQKITAAANEGLLSDVLEMLTHPKVYINDQSGYFKACKEAEALDSQIESFSKLQDIRQQGVLYGQRITVLISYILCFAVSLILIFE